jgi:crotonobetainyl-CoA:carnitine CoA-transferase CaiB-like acyl-CoA transferase
MPVKLSARPVKREVKAPLLGEDNQAVLTDLLELSDKEIAELYADGVLYRDPILKDRP